MGGLHFGFVCSRIEPELFITVVSVNRGRGFFYGIPEYGRFLCPLLARRTVHCV